MTTNNGSTDSVLPVLSSYDDKSKISKVAALRQVAVTLSSGLSCMAVGSCMGWPSPTLERLLSPEWQWQITGDQSSWVVSFLDLGVVLGSLPAGWAADRFGRKPVLLSSSVLFAASWILVLVATRVEFLYAARLLAGLASSIAMIVTVMYAGEVSEDRLRGANSTLIATLMNLGTVFSYSLGPYVSYHTLAAASLIIPALFVLSFLFSPESPHYLLMQGRRLEAEQALAYLRGAKDHITVIGEVNQMEASISERSRGAVISASSAVRELLWEPGSDRTAFGIVMALTTMQSLSGFSAAMAYSAITLPGELATNVGPNEFVIFFGILSTLATLLSTAAIDRVGRRPLLIAFGLLQAISLGASAIYYTLETRAGADISPWRWVPSAALLLFGIAYPVGLGSVPNTLQVELFSTRVKAIALPTVLVSFNLLTFLMSKTYEVVSRNVGHDAAYWFFCGDCLAAVAFTIFVVKETKGKSFCEIQALFDPPSRRNTVNRWPA